MKPIEESGLDYSKFGFYFVEKYSMMYLYSMEFVLNDLFNYLHMFMDGDM